jgi:predicted  nucleic acid-binding Zn-ribbon protein
MSTATMKGAARRHPALDRQISQAKAILRELRDTLEDLDDRRELARAKKRNADKRGTDWEAAKKELGLEF